LVTSSIKPNTEEELEFLIYRHLEKIYEELTPPPGPPREEKNKINFIKTMNSVETPSNIQKTLTLLKSQIEKADLDGTYMVSPNSVLYFTDQQTQIIQAEGPKYESDGQRLCRKMPEFLQDIRRSGISFTPIETPPGDTW
ncbi:1719_t:CDS:2, partial [Racocetra fulgida]